MNPLRRLTASQKSLRLRSGPVPVIGLGNKMPRIVTMFECARRFIREETGQDLVEYSLLIVFYRAGGSRRVYWHEQ